LNNSAEPLNLTYVPAGGNAARGESFMETLDNTCDRLQEKQALYLIKKLDKLDALLGGLESELDLLIQKTPL